MALVFWNWGNSMDVAMSQIFVEDRGHDWHLCLATDGGIGRRVCDVCDAGQKGKVTSMILSVFDS